MALRTWKTRRSTANLAGSPHRLADSVKARRPRECRPGLDRLEDRTLLTVSSQFLDGVLTITSDADDAIVLTVMEGDMANSVLINGEDPDTGPLNPDDVESIAIFGGPGDNLINLVGVSNTLFIQEPTIDINAGDGDDTILLGTETNLNGGIVDGQGGINTLDYSASTSPVMVNLGADSIAFANASLDGDQEVPPAMTMASGQASLRVDQTTGRFDLVLVVDGISTSQLMGAGPNSTPIHLHNAPAGANGPIVVDLAMLGTIVPNDMDTGFTLTVVDQLFGDEQGAINSDIEANIEALLAGELYFNVHTMTFPAGEIRGQAMVTGNGGSATRTGAVRNISNVTGGSGNDTLIGNDQDNILIGGPGNDILDGGPGNDILDGGPGDDIIRGGLGRDTIIGGPGSDTIFGNQTEDDAPVFVGLGIGNTLLTFSADAPGTIQSTTMITGLEMGEIILGLDTRPATGEVYALTSNSNLYTVNPFSGVATLSSTLSTPLEGTAFGVDFNPIPDRLRVVSNTNQNLRINVETGATIVDGTLAYAMGDANAGANPNIVAAAYLNPFAGTTTTTLYGIDSNLNILVTQSPPNAGVLNTVGALGFNVSEVISFDIAQGSNTAFAVFAVGGSTNLYTIDLETGQASFVAAVGDGMTAISGLTALTDENTIIWNNGDGSDVIHGGSGRDTAVVNGAPAGDIFEISVGDNGRLDFQRTNLGPFTLDIGRVQVLKVDAGLGEDTIIVNDLTGVEHLDTLDLDGGFENDMIDASALPAGVVETVILRGGPGNDTIIGSQGDDMIFGGQGNDTIIGGGGNDTIVAGITAETALFAALRDDNTALIFTADATGQIMEVPLTGLEAGELAIGIDFRPAEERDVLYVLTDQGRIYTATPNGQLTLLSTLDVTLNGMDFGVDFNPVPDRLRVVSDTNQNLRINVDTGATIVDGMLAYSPVDANFGVDPQIAGVAYINSFDGATTTTLFGIDAGLNTLVIQSPPNEGVLRTVGPLGVDVEAVIGFDILTGTTETAFAALRVEGTTGLYLIDLATGEATLVGIIGDGSSILVGLAVAPDNDTIIWNNGDGSDVIDGGAGRNTSIVNGANAGDNFEISAGEDGRLFFERTNLGMFSLDMGTIQVLEVNGRAGDDRIIVNDLTGVDDLELLVLNGGDGDDLIDASGMVVPIPVEASGGPGNDVLIGGPGNDSLDGGPGNDRLDGGGGVNTLTNASSNFVDYDGDFRTDLGVYRPSTQEFLISLTGGGTIVQQFGNVFALDIPLAGDFDGDLKTDIAVFRPETAEWLILLSGGGTRVVTFGDTDLRDIPITGDFDGDGRTDLGVFRPSTGQWLISLSSGGTLVRTFGDTDLRDIPIPGDYDGDNITDFAVFRPATGQWLILLSGGGTRVVTFGDTDLRDIPVPGDYDGDLITDLAVFRPSTGQFFVSLSGGGVMTPFFGAPDLFDLPLAAPIGALAALGLVDTDLTSSAVASSSLATTSSFELVPFAALGLAEGVETSPAREALDRLVGGREGLNRAAELLENAETPRQRRQAVRQIALDLNSRADDALAELGTNRREARNLVDTALNDLGLNIPLLRARLLRRLLG